MNLLKLQKLKNIKKNNKILTLQKETVKELKSIMNKKNYPEYKELLNNKSNFYQKLNKDKIDKEKIKEYYKIII